MKRVILAALTGAAFFAFAHRTADAMVEFCPASLHYERVGPQSEKNSPGDLYGFNLSALGPRTIESATVAFDTNGGWYTVDVPPAAVSEKERHYTAPWVTFTRRDYVSPVLYARFPQPVSIAHAWVYSASVQNDAFGWQPQGLVQCDPYAVASPGQAGKLPFLHMGSYTLDPKDDDALSAPPSSTSLVIPAKSSQALENAGCAEPFRIATVKTIARPHYPSTLMGPADQISTAVEVAVTGDGTLADARVWGPSGFPAFDDEALRAAKASTYTGAAAYCKPVPGFYFFRVTFDPNR